MTRPAGWSLSNRLVWMTTGLIVTIVLPLAGVCGYLLLSSAGETVDRLLEEELVELDMLVAGRTVDEASLGGAVALLMAGHPEYRFGWTVWDDAEGPVVATAGDADLLARAGLDPRVLDTTVEVSGSVRARTARLQGGQLAGLAVDGSAAMAELRDAAGMSAGLVLAAAVAVILATTLYCRRVTSLLKRVAAQAHWSDGPPDSAALPNEIRPVAEAFDERLRTLRTESKEARVMIAKLAHDLRRPIQNLIGETEVALLVDDEGSSPAATLRSNLEELRSLGDAVDNLVTMCSPSAVVPDVRYERFDLAAEAELRLDRDLSQARRRRVDVEIRARGDTTIVGDREWLLRALRNLTSNAVDFSPEGSRVTVDIGGEADRVVVTVDDAGPGVPEPDRERIFEAFVRGPGSREQRDGYGLGLAIVRAAVEAHHGAVTVGDSEQGGARFRLTIPRRPTDVGRVSDPSEPRRAAR